MTINAIIQQITASGAWVNAMLILALILVVIVFIAALVVALAGGK